MRSLHVVAASAAESRAIALAQGRDIALTSQIAALDARRRQDLDHLAEAEAEQRTVLSGHAASIWATLAADPAYDVPNDGLLARLRALAALTADSWGGAVVFLLEAFFAGIELAAVFVTLLNFVPATCATRGRMSSDRSPRRAGLPRRAQHLQRRLLGARS